ncbi:MAG: hypothetical protein RTU30_12345 [Candidatus Thorarchaeota archaeon]
MVDQEGIRTIDVGSFPLDADLQRYLLGASDIERNSGRVETDESKYFVAKHNSTFFSKAKALGPKTGVTAYAQCRGMIDQFLLPVVQYVTKNETQQTSIHSSFGNITKEDAQAVAIAIATGSDVLTNESVIFPEIIALQQEAEQLCRNLGVASVSYKSCITGPLELSLNLQRLAEFPRTYDEKLVEYFTEVVNAYVKQSLITSTHLIPEVITLDEPAFGLEGIGDFFSDTASDTNLDHLISCWNKIYDLVPSKCYRGVHLHVSPFERIFQANWNLLEAHVGVFVNRNWLEDYDKFVRAAVVKTDGPTIDESVDVKVAWQEILSGNYQDYLQSSSEMEKHLRVNIGLYGLERIPFAGPECGLGPWDWRNGNEMAQATLDRMRDVVYESNQSAAF